MLHLDAENSVPGLFAASHPAALVLGWGGFLDVRFILNSLGVLLLATVLGAAIGYHPATRRTIDKLHEADMPHVYVMYAVIGAVIGVAVREFGTVVGVVVFGIGGLIRFRSSADSTKDTVRLIIVTLAGLIAGLGLLHFAVIIIAFAFILIWLFDSSPPFRIRIEGLKWDHCGACAEAYRTIVVAYRNNAPVMLRDVAEVVDGLENTRVGGWYNGRTAIVLDVQKQPGANIIDAVNRLKLELPRLQRSLPAGAELVVVHDRTQTIRASIADVQFTLVLAIGLVVLVVLLFLRTMRATIIAGVTLPLSILASFAAMWVAGFSLDNLSLMALTGMSKAATSASITNSSMKFMKMFMAPSIQSPRTFAS